MCGFGTCHVRKVKGKEEGKENRRETETQSVCVGLPREKAKGGSGSGLRGAPGGPWRRRRHSVEWPPY